MTLKESRKITEIIIGLHDGSIDAEEAAELLEEIVDGGRS